MTSKRWVCRQTVCRLNARRYGLLSLAFCFGSFPAMDLLRSGFASLLPWAAILCWLILLAHVLTIVLAIWHGLAEKPRTLTRRFLDPNYDQREL